jgi:hypothetical protein
LCSKSIKPGPASTIKLEAGQFDTYRVLGMLNLLGNKAKQNGRSWYAASAEYARCLIVALIIIKQLFFSPLSLTLYFYLDFTFFLVDTVNGDEIRQREARNLYGYNGSYKQEAYLGNIKLTTDLGVSARLDLTNNSELSHTVNRYTLIDPIKLGDVTELGTGLYASETFQFNSRFTVNAGLAV